MNTIHLIFCFSLSIIINYFTQKVYIFLNKYDDINHRSSHSSLATRTGGVGVFTTLLIISLYYYFNGIELFDYSLFIPFGIMFIVGVYDDFYKADFKLKFFLQIIVSKILIDQGYVISNYHGLFGLYEIPWLLAQISTVLVFLIVVNAINFVDGIDGLAISQILKIILFVEILSKKTTPLGIFGYSLIASIIPLYFFNFKKNKKVFLGDGGSLFLGTVAVVYIYYLISENSELIIDGINKTLLSIICILFPLIDMFRVILIRIYNKKSPFIADNKHIHHYLISKFSHLKSLSIIILCDLIISFFCLLLLVS